MSERTKGCCIVTDHHGRAAVGLEDFPQIIADCGRQEDAEANAAFIALAWNCHDDLVAALRDLLKVYRFLTVEAQQVHPDALAAADKAFADAMKETGK